MDKDKDKLKVKKKVKKTYTYSKTRKKKPVTKRYRTSRDYDFLQYIRIIFKWVTTNYNLTRIDVELLLYTYPKGTFTTREFNDYHRVMGMYAMKTFDRFVREGWIVLWRPKRRNETALWSLTNKAKVLCDKMHKMAIGEIDIPTNPQYNNLAKKSPIRIHGYYMDAIKKMNSTREE